MADRMRHYFPSKRRPTTCLTRIILLFVASQGIGVDLMVDNLLGKVRPGEEFGMCVEHKWN